MFMEVKTGAETRLENDSIIYGQVTYCLLTMSVWFLRFAILDSPVYIDEFLELQTMKQNRMGVAVIAQHNM